MTKFSALRGRFGKLAAGAALALTLAAGLSLSAKPADAAPLPDMVTSMKTILGPMPATMQKNSHQTVIFTAKNVGGTTAVFGCGNPLACTSLRAFIPAGFTVMGYDASPGTTCVIAAPYIRCLKANVAPGTEISVSVRLTAPSVTGWKQFQSQTDTFGVVAESNEGNNAAFWWVNVTP